VFIDWLTVGAQVINFVVLVWLLQKFLYRPVLAAIDARERTIAKRIRDAQTREAQAKAQEEKFRQCNEEFATERVGLLSKANEEAGTERQRLLESARTEAAVLRANLAQQLIKERDNLTSRVVTNLQSEVFALTSSTLAQLADDNLEHRMVEVFLRRLDESSTRGAASAHVRSAFDLQPQQRGLIAQRLGGVPVTFERAPELVCGIELIVGDVKMVWTIPDHIDGMTARVTALLTPAVASSG
jgi:F-type H+-transporting ATPase subunit b